jgi:spore germination cell wall hydrolase CwlJ-like protein
MKRLLAATAVAASILLIASARAASDGEIRADAAPAGGADLSGWTRPLAPGVEARSTAAESAALGAAPETEPAETDVVDAHWMALTMWGEARSGGEEAMRAVGHVIANRRAAGHHGDYVTETVSAPRQFSAWNASDPNRRAMIEIDALRAGSRDDAMWQAAKRLAEEILAGRSADPTGGALFYHTAEVAPLWSRGMEPVARIGGHLFFRRAA